MANEQAGGLDSLWLELTRKCNLACNHCYADSHPGRDLLGAMSQEDWLSVLNGAADMGCCYVQFIGGEPLLHPAVEALARRARDRGMDVEILTNGTVLGSRNLAWMAELGVDVSTSVYSACAPDHDAMTGRQGSWQRTVANIDSMVREGLRVRAGIIYRDWDADRVVETSDFLKKMGVLVGTDRVRGIGRGGSTASHAAYLGELCGACGNRRACVTNGGEVYPCIMARQTPLGNVRRASLGSILARKTLSNFRRELVAQRSVDAACTPDCWPNGGCAPHDVCNPHKSSGNCTPDCWPHGGCAPHDLCNPHKITAATSETRAGGLGREEGASEA
jgi:MoaA/NifB/PqqE/SkfB family radical SAM enzyme